MRADAPGVSRSRLIPRPGPAPELCVRPPAGRPGCGCVGHRGPQLRSLARSLALLGLAGQQANRSCSLAVNPEACPSVFSLEEEEKKLHRLCLNAPLNWGNVSDVIINKNFPSLDTTARASPPLRPG